MPMQIFFLGGGGGGEGRLKRCIMHGICASSEWSSFETNQKLRSTPSALPPPGIARGERFIILKKNGKLVILVTVFLVIRVQCVLTVLFSARLSTQ